MGYMRHHAMAVTGGYGDYIDRAHAEAARLGLIVTPITGSHINGYRSFFVAPDGSKEGWEDSDQFDTARAAFARYLETLRYEDRSSPLAWVEVQYGDDNHETKVTRDSDNVIRVSGYAE